MEAAPLPPAGEGGAKRRVRARRSRCGESVAALTTGAPGANALGGKCPPPSACGRRLFLVFAPKDIRTRVPAFTAAHERKGGASAGTTEPAFAGVPDVAGSGRIFMRRKRLRRVPPTPLRLLVEQRRPTFNHPYDHPT